jgi:hypothetical protein
MGGAGAALIFWTLPDNRFSPHPGPLPIGSAASADAEMEKRPSRLAKSRLQAARRLADLMKLASGCSFSPGEKVRMRGKGSVKSAASRFPSNEFTDLLLWIIHHE